MKPESRRSAEMSAATETSRAPSFGSRVGSKRPAGIGQGAGEPGRVGGHPLDHGVATIVERMTGLGDRIWDLSATPSTPLGAVDGVGDRVADLSLA
jgi:hypothetical protein